MPRTLSKFSKDLLAFVASSEAKTLHEVYSAYKQDKKQKDIYNNLYRLVKQELLFERDKKFVLAPLGAELIHKLNPQKDGIWKIIIFDIPESQRYVRNFLRAKLTALGFKKWQNSIWVSPFVLDPELEKELLDLAKKFFVRLIKTTDINYSVDLEKLFE